MDQVYISIGSNLGDRIYYCKKAIDEIAGLATIVKLSSLFETEPVDKEDQPKFINSVAEIDTDLSPHELLMKLNLIEEKLGRVRHEKWSPRTIDLDIIFYGDQVIKDDNLVIPHERAHLRRFVLQPLCEIAPEFIHPKFNLTATELVKKCEDNKGVIKIENTSTFSQQ